MTSKRHQPLSTEKQKNTSNIVNIEEMAQAAIKEQKDNHIKELEKTNVALGQTVDKLMTELTRKEEFIKHLEQLLSGSAQIIRSDVIMYVSDEEQIVTKQLEYLKQQALVRPLTLDEMKMLDLAVKTKRLSQEKPTSIEGSKRNPLSLIPTNELLKIAAKPLTEKE